MSRTDGVAGGTSLALEQQIDTAAFLGLSLRCALLTVATLGLYGFWGRSEARRWLWDATALGGEPLEYGGTGGELLAGFVIKWLAVGGCLLGAWASFRAMGPWGAPLIVLLTGAGGPGRRGGPGRVAGPAHALGAGAPERTTVLGPQAGVIAAPGGAGLPPGARRG